MNRLERIDRSRIYIPQEQVRDGARGRIRAGAIVVEREGTSRRLREGGVHIRGADFYAELELVRTAHPGKIVHVGIADCRSLQVFLGALSESLQPRNIHGREKIRIKRVQVDL